MSVKIQQGIAEGSGAGQLTSVSIRRRGDDILAFGGLGRWSFVAVVRA
jgi:hypothetical protein